MTKIHKLDLTNNASKFPKELNKVIENTVKLIDSIQTLRGKYIAEDDLPLLPFNTDYENMLIVARAIGQEAMKFGLPGTTEFCIFDEKELTKMCKDEHELEKSGLDEWVKEGLFDKDFYANKVEKDEEQESPYLKFMKSKVTE